MSTSHLAVLGGKPEFEETLHVGRPNGGDRVRLAERFDEVLDRVWFTNNGPMVQKFEQTLANRFAVRHVIAVCNATLGLEIATRAAGVEGEVVVPSFTFVATAHAIQWQGLTPVFADVVPSTHLIDVDSVESLITPRTTAILGVHTWGVGCETEALQRLAARKGLTVMYDAAHAIGCTHRGRPFGSNGLAEVFSFHATKYVNSFEGGAIATNDDALAERIRHMVNFGFEGPDLVTSVGTNAKMSEISAAMGLTSLESEPSFAHQNRIIWDAYTEQFATLPGLSLYTFPEKEINSRQYVVVEVAEECALSRDEIVAVLHAENCMARRYFFPGVHRMEPYASLAPMSTRWLPNTEALTRRVLTLPTGTAMSPDLVGRVSTIIASALTTPKEIARSVARTAPFASI